MLKEFKEFALKGNAIELAVGVIIGGAFQSIVNSLVNDIIMPLLSLLFGNVDFSNWVWNVGNTTITYGVFVSAVINFLLVAFSLFMVVKYINKFNAKLEKARLEQMNKIKNATKDNKLLGKFKKEKKEEKESKVSEPEITTKLCPFCFSEINIHASRCPHCTSKLEEE